MAVILAEELPEILLLELLLSLDAVTSLEIRTVTPTF
jgi:hypothetical protein